jgi:hypothetical protein
MKCWYNGSIQLRKGETIKITKAYEDPYGDYKLRVNGFEVVSSEAQRKSSFDTNELPGPVIGRVLRSFVNDETNTTFFEIQEGRFDDDVFVKAGELKKGQDALKEIFATRIDVYVKIWDPYISVGTIRLVSNVGNSIKIDIMTQKITNVDEVKKEADKLLNRIIIKKGLEFHDHDRFILTKGEGWSVGHSLKDFGTRNSNLEKLPVSTEVEMAFDENWNQSKTIYDNN